MGAVARLDDGRSDPTSIAYGLSSQCAVLYQQFSDTMERGAFTENAQAFARRQSREMEMRLITSAILHYRAAGPEGKRALAQGKSQ